MNNLLDAQADELCGAKRYERSADRVDTRAGSYNRDLETKAGKVSLKVPRLRSLPFETQIIERYKRRESSVEVALVEEDRNRCAHEEYLSGSEKKARLLRSGKRVRGVEAPPREAQPMT